MTFTVSQPFMVHQALNGYSIVFSTAITRAAAGVLLARKGYIFWGFKKVFGVKGLLEGPDSEAETQTSPNMVVPILCLSDD